MLVHDVGQVLLVADGIFINGYDQVTANQDGSRSQIGALVATMQAGAIRGAALDDSHDQDAVIGRQAKFLRQPGPIGNETMPSDGRRTVPRVIKSFSTALAVLIGMAKPMPAL